MKNKIFLSLIIAGIIGSALAPLTGWGKRPYKSVLKAWTENGEAYNFQSLEARLVWTCTLESPDFLEAKVDFLSEKIPLPSQKVEELKRDELSLAEKYDSFFCAIYVGSRVHRFIGKNRSEWQLVRHSIRGHEEQVDQPLAWEEVPNSQLTQMLYPYIDRWSKAYRVKFPKSIGSGTDLVRLSMVTIPADSTLEWNLARLRN